MTATNKILSVIAFYLSEYDMQAVSELGFRTRNAAIQTISEQVGSGNNYLKLRRDEFDALPDSASQRKGWRNRPPIKEVVELAAYLHQFSFEELTEIVRAFLSKSFEDQALPDDTPAGHPITPVQEDEIERIMNMSDPSAGIRVTVQPGKVRVYNRAIITQLKHLYRGRCQICGRNPVDAYGVDITEAHHIAYFSESHNNDPDNIIILCPNHHKLIHTLNPAFDSSTLTFSCDDGRTMIVTLDYHLQNK